MVAGRMVARFAAGLALLASFTPAAAAPLCRDSRGLFTPCPRAANKTAQAILASAPAYVAIAPHEPGPHRAAAADTRREETARADTPRPDANPLLRRTRLCTDTRGLFTPCPR